MHARVCLALLLAIAARSLPAQQVDTVTDADLVIAGLKVGDLAVTAQHILGRPTAISARRLSYPGLLLLLDARGRCDEFVVTSPSWVTARGLRVGDSVARVYQLYGDWASMQDSTYVLYERSPEDPNRNGLGLMVRLRGGKVTTIQLGAVIDAS